MVGIFGGTFDPPHLGHVFIVQSLLRLFPLREIRIFPTGIPPHRPVPVASAQDRCEMARLAFGSISKVFVDEWEIGRSGPAYTLDTLSHIVTTIREGEGNLLLPPEKEGRSLVPPGKEGRPLVPPGKEGRPLVPPGKEGRPLVPPFGKGGLGGIFLILGIDAFVELPNWHRPREIFNLAQVLVIPRAGIADSKANQLIRQVMATLGVDLKQVTYAEAVIPPKISSTLIRQRILQKKEVQSLLPKVVWEWIKQKHLYGFEGFEK